MARDTRERLVIETLVEDAASRDLKRIGKNVDRVGDQTERSFRRGSKSAVGFQDALGGLVTKAGIAAAAVGAIYATGRVAQRGISEATEFGQSIAEVTTLIDISSSGVARLSNEVLGLADAQLANEQVVAKGLYQAISGGISDVGEALTFVEAGGRLAIAGVSDTASAVDVLSTAVNAYGGEAEDAEHVSDVLFRTVKRGKTTIGELSASLGQVLPLAASLGVEFEEVNAAVASLTLNGVSTSEAVTQVRAALTALLKSSEDIGQIFEANGQEFNLTELRTRGLVAVLQDLEEATNGDAEALTNLLGRTEAVNAVLGLTGENAGRTVEILQDLEAAAGDTAAAFDKQMLAPANRLRGVFNAMRIAAVRFGQRFLQSFDRIFTRFQQAEHLRALLADLGLNLAALGEVGFQAFELSAILAIDALEGMALAASKAYESIDSLVGSVERGEAVLARAEKKIYDLNAAFGGLLFPVLAAERAITRLRETWERWQERATAELLLPVDVSEIEELAKGVDFLPEEIEKRAEEIFDTRRIEAYGKAVGDARESMARFVREANLKGLVSEVEVLRSELTALSEIDVDDPLASGDLGARDDALRRTNELLDAYRGMIVPLSEVDEKVKALGASDRYVFISEVQDRLAWAAGNVTGDLEAQEAVLGELVVFYRELEDSGLKQEEIQRLIARLENDRARAARLTLDAQTRAHRQRLAQIEEEKKARREVLGPDKSLQAQKAANALIRSFQRDTLDGVAKERQERRDLLYTVRQTAHALEQAGKIGSLQLKRIVGLVDEAQRADVEFFEAKEAETVAKWMETINQLQAERESGLRAQLIAIDRVIEGHKNEAREQAKGNQQAAEHLDAHLSRLERERDIRKENARATEEQARAQELFARITAPRFDTENSSIFRRALEETNTLLDQGAIRSQEYEEALRSMFVSLRQGGEALQTGFTASLDDFVDQARNDFEFGAQAAQTFGFSLTDNLAQGFYDVAGGAASGSEAVEEFARNFAASMLQMSTQALALEVTSGALGALGFGSESIEQPAQEAGLALSVGGQSAADAVRAAGTQAGLALAAGGERAAAAMLLASRSGGGISVGAAATGGAAAAQTGAGLAASVFLAEGGVVPGGLGKWSPVPTIPYAQAGPIVRRPHVAVIGEGEYDEAVVPLPNGREIPVDMRGLDLGGRRDSAPAAPQVVDSSTHVESTVTLNVTAPPGTSADEGARQAIRPETLRQIENAIASAIASGSNRKLRSSIKDASR